MNTPNNLHLAKPGAGLPQPELLIARLRFRITRWRLKRDEVSTWFETEADKIRSLVNECPPEHRSTPTLIRRLRGMEDSSRNWSIHMTLDHLQIVNHGVAGIIKKLAQTEPPTIATVSTADVKPDPDAREKALLAFEHSVSHVQARIAKIENLKTQWHHPHPWFGPLDAHGFYTLLAMHMGIHRKQIERIVKAL